jgi:hypothetical protein
MALASFGAQRHIQMNRRAAALQGQRGLVRKGIVVQDSISLAILLVVVVEGECDGVSLEQVGQRRHGRESIHQASGALAPELHVFLADLSGASGSGAGWRMFSDSLEKEEHQGHQIRESLVLGVERGAFIVHCIFDHGCWKCPLRLWCWDFIFATSMTQSREGHRAQLRAANFPSGVAT